jgi:hypothetical protein
MMPLLLPVLVALAPQAAPAAAPEHFSVSASFQAPAKPGGLGAVMVAFAPKDPDVNINATSVPVAWAGKPPASRETLKADVVYFYCSKREGWCRKGTAPVEFSVP